MGAENNDPGLTVSHLMAIPCTDSAGGSFYLFAPWSLTGSDASAVAWFESQGAAIAGEFCGWINGGEVPAAAAVLFRASDGAALRSYVAGEGFEASTAAALTVIAFNDDYGYLYGADRGGAGDASAQAAARAWFGLNSGYSGTTIYVGRRVVGGGDGSMSITLPGTMPSVTAGS